MSARCSAYGIGWPLLDIASIPDRKGGHPRGFMGSMTSFGLFGRGELLASGRAVVRRRLRAFDVSDNSGAGGGGGVGGVSRSGECLDLLGFVGNVGIFHPNGIWWGELELLGFLLFYFFRFLGVKWFSL